MDSRLSSLARRALVAAVISCAVAGFVPAASAIASPVSAPATGTFAKAKVKVEAKLEKDHVKVGETTKLKGSLDVVDGTRVDGINALETLVVQQQLQTGAWVDLTTTPCRPNGGFSVGLRFSLSATVSLRVYHPETTLYASVYSSIYTLLVL